MKYKIKDNSHTDSMKNDIISNFFKQAFLITLGSFIMAFGIDQFMMPNQLSTGGFSGIALIIYYLFGISLGTATLALNIPLFILSYFKIGKDFLLRAIFGTVLLSFFLNVLETFPSLTNDKFLACIYGGVIIGLGTALVFKGSGSTGGSDLITSIIKNFKPGISTSTVIMVFDIAVVLLNVIVFQTIEIGLYSAIAIFLMGKIIDLVFEGINFSKVMFIISDKYDDISKVISTDVQRGITGLYGKGMYTNDDKTVLLCVTSRNEVVSIRTMVEEIDPNAFIIIANAREVFGKGFKEEKLLK